MPHHKKYEMFTLRKILLQWNNWIHKTWFAHLSICMDIVWANLQLLCKYCILWEISIIFKSFMLWDNCLPVLHSEQLLGACHWVLPYLHSKSWFLKQHYHKRRSSVFIWITSTDTSKGGFFEYQQCDAFLWNEEKSVNLKAWVYI